MTDGVPGISITGSGTYVQLSIHACATNVYERAGVPRLAFYVTKERLPRPGSVWMWLGKYMPDLTISSNTAHMEDVKG